MRSLEEIIANNKQATAEQLAAFVALDKALDCFKRTVHPVVRVNPRTGAKVVVYE